MSNSKPKAKNNFINKIYPDNIQKDSEKAYSVVSQLAKTLYGKTLNQCLGERQNLLKNIPSQIELHFNGSYKSLSEFGKQKMNSMINHVSRSTNVNVFIKY